MLKRIVAAISALGLTGFLLATPSGAATQVKEKTEHAANVDTTNGVVTLKGTVPTRAARAKAVRITRASKGVKHVVNQLTIGAS